MSKLIRIKEGIFEGINYNYVKQCGYNISSDDEAIFIDYDRDTENGFTVLTISLRLTSDEVIGMVLDFFTRNCHPYQNKLLKEKLNGFLDNEE